MSPEPANPTLQVHGQSIHALNEKRCSDEGEDENINRLRRFGLLEGGDQRLKAGGFTRESEALVVSVCDAALPLPEATTSSDLVKVPQAKLIA